MMATEPASSLVTKAMPAVVAEARDHVDPGQCDPGRQRALVGGLQDGDSRVGMAGGTAGDPQVPAVGLHGQAVGADSGRRARRHLPCLGIDDGHLIGVGHGDEDLAAARPRAPSRLRPASGTRARSFVPPKPKSGSTTVIVALWFSVTA